MLMESRADWAYAAMLRAQSAAASGKMTVLRVTLIASGGDARQFMTAVLQDYYDSRSPGFNETATKAVAATG
jgi:hypothetical protein